MDPVKLEEKERQRRNKELVKNTMKAATAAIKKAADEQTAYKEKNISYWTEDEKWGLEPGTLPDKSEIKEEPVKLPPLPGFGGEPWRTEAIREPQKEQYISAPSGYLYEAPSFTEGIDYHRIPNPDFDKEAGERMRNILKVVGDILEETKLQRLRNGAMPGFSGKWLFSTEDSYISKERIAQMTPEEFLYGISFGENYLPLMSDDQLKEFESFLENEREKGEQWLKLYEPNEKDYDKAMLIQTAEKEAIAQPDFEEKAALGKRNAVGPFPRDIEEYGPYNEIENQIQRWEKWQSGEERESPINTEKRFTLGMERDVYAYYLMTDPEMAKQYLEAIGGTINYRSHLQGLKNSKQMGKEHPIISGLSSVLLKGITALPMISETLDHAIDGEELDPYSGLLSSYGIMNSAREGALENLPEGWMRSGGEAFYAGLDALPGIGLDLLAPGAGRAYSGITSAAEGMADASIRGAPALNALGYGSAVGVTDVVLDKFFSDVGNEIGDMVKTRNKKGFANLMKKEAAEFGKDVTQNVSNQAIDQVFDDLILQEEAYVKKYAQNLIDRGTSEQEAYAAVREFYYSGYDENAFKSGLVQTLGEFPLRFIG